MKLHPYIAALIAGLWPQLLLAQGAGQIAGSVAPGGGLQANITVGSSIITGGVDTRVLYDNAGVLGEYVISGTGSVCMTTNCVMVTPTLGVATGTSLALGGATLGGNALAVTGTSLLGSTTIGAGSAITSSGPGGALTSAAFTALGTSGATIPLLNTLNAWSAVQNINSGATTIASTLTSTGTFAFTSYVDTNTTPGQVAFGSNGNNAVIVAGGVVRATLAVGGNFTIGGTFTAALASTATTSAVCYNTGTGLFTYNATVGTCTVSTLAAKDLVAPLSPQEGFDMVVAQEPWRYDLKPGLPTYTPGEQIGLVAEYVTDPRLVASNPDGSRAGVRYEQYTAALTAAVKYLAARVDALEAR